MASGSNQPFCHSTLSGQTDRLTHRLTDGLGDSSVTWALTHTILIDSNVLTTTITILWPFVRDYLGELVPEETFSNSHLSWSSTMSYQLPQFITIHSILPIQFMCLTSFCTTSLQVLHGLPLGLESSTSYSIDFFTQWWENPQSINWLMGTYRCTHSSCFNSNFPKVGQFATLKNRTFVFFINKMPFLSSNLHFIILTNLNVVLMSHMWA